MIYLSVVLIYLIPGYYLLTHQKASLEEYLTGLFSISLGLLVAYVFKNKDDDKIQRILNRFF